MASGIRSSSPALRVAEASAAHAPAQAQRPRARRVEGAHGQQQEEALRVGRAEVHGRREDRQQQQRGPREPAAQLELREAVEEKQRAEEGGQ